MSVDLLRTSVDRAKKENGGLEVLGMRFYERLFEKYPSVRPLFPKEMKSQAGHLMAAVGWIVANVDNAAVFKPGLEEMAIRHLGYGTLEAHYPAVGENLVAVLEEHLSVEGEFSEETKTAWVGAYDAIQSIMIAKAYPKPENAVV
jgi:hemoglobin-like flavoprotein